MSESEQTWSGLPKGFLGIPGIQAVTIFLPLFL